MFVLWAFTAEVTGDLGALPWVPYVQQQCGEILVGRIWPALEILALRRISFRVLFGSWTIEY